MRKSLYLVPASLVPLCLLFGTGCKKQEPTRETASSNSVQQMQVPSSLPSHTFEGGTEGWYGIKGVAVAATTSQHHEGKGSLEVSGTSNPPFWNYAKSPKFQLEPNKKYKLSGWIYVNKLSKTDAPPFLKVDISQNGKWITNKLTGRYNTGKIQQWQELSCVFVTPNQGNLDCFVAIEKGKRELSVTTDLYVDDVKLEAI